MPSVLTMTPLQHQSNQELFFSDCTNRPDNVPAGSASLPVKASKQGRWPGEFFLKSMASDAPSRSVEKKPPGNNHLPPPSPAVSGPSPNDVAPSSNVAALPVTAWLYRLASLVVRPTPALISLLRPVGACPLDPPAVFCPALVW